MSALCEGFFVYRLDATTSTFLRVKTFAANTRALPLQYIDANVAGKIEYSIAALNTAGEAKSNLIGAEAKEPGCTLSPSGGLFENGVVAMQQRMRSESGGRCWAC